MFVFAYEEAVIGTANQISYTRLKTHNYWSVGKKKFYATPVIIFSGLEITAGQRTMSGLIVDLTGQTFVLPVMLTGQNSIVLKMK